MQVPYRLPFKCATCGKSLTRKQRLDIALAAQRAQDAQTGYCSDYCAKNQPMGMHEIKEFQKGHAALHGSIRQQGIEYIGKRHVARLMSDAYCKGIVRGQVECCNLRANHSQGQIVSAERISTADFVTFPGHAFLEAVDRHVDANAAQKGPSSRQNFVRAKPTPMGARHLREADLVRAYGHRPCDAACWWLSPYEFVMYWDIVPARVPQTRHEWEASDDTAWDIKLTPAGMRKIGTQAGDKLLRLRAGQHYRISVTETVDRRLFPNTPGNATLRNAWFLQRRGRPLCPHFAQSAVPRRFGDNVEQNARMAKVYFSAWTLDQARGTAAVPYVGHLRTRTSGESWEAALRRWASHGLPCEETKRYLGNFLSVYRVRPAADAKENSDDDGADEALELSVDLLPTALQTQPPGQNEKRTPATKHAQSAISATGFELAEMAWPQGKPSKALQPDKTGLEQLDPKAVLRATRQVNALPKHGRGPIAAVPAVEATVRPIANPAAGKKALAWADQLPLEVCNPQQKEFCKVVARRVAAELETEPQDVGKEDPLRWVLHGGPGTGKSYALNLIRKGLFEEALGWQQGVEYQVVTFQAVMAEALAGDTIHHALGLNWAGSKDSGGLKRLLELSLATLQWRWLIIDEFSMVSAELFAQLERRCREIMRDLSVAKYGTFDGTVRPFGGLNVVLAGDLYQLPPPRGTFIGDVPWQLLTGQPAARTPLSAQGQNLIWGTKQEGMQGVTELSRCERTADEWLASVQAELREGKLSTDNHAFLHGHPTSVPGSWCQDHLTCRNAKCQEFVRLKKSAEEIMQNECELCKEERWSRKLVATEATDPRFQGAFRFATTIFSTNDIKYHVNKVRARAWAAAAATPMHYAIARDTASSTVLQEKPHLLQEKVTWLQRHDQECGGLYGVLPICLGLPIRATEHLDRGRGILKGCKGKVVGWSTAAATEIWNTLPAVIYIQFETAGRWHIEGMPHGNVYPVSPMRKPWFLDRNRNTPQLRVSRLQFPLAPGFAVTAHIAQGQTLQEGVVADFNISDTGNPFTTYVAATRVTGRDKLLILRPFPAAPFQKGIGIGRALLLQLWRGDPINWEALRRKFADERPCSECSERKNKNAFTVGQWKRDDAARICRECVERHRAVGEPYQCCVCQFWFPETGFPPQHRSRQCSFYRVCLTCELRKPCALCNARKGATEYTASAWKTRNAERRICHACTTKVRGSWHCATCRQRLPKERFKTFRQRRPSGQDGTQVCDKCQQAAVVKPIAARTTRRLTRSRQKVRKKEILDEVRREIAVRVRGHGRQPQEETHPKRARPDGGPSTNLAEKAVAHEEQEQRMPRRQASEQAREPQKGEATEQNEYECPYCQAKTYSSIRTGKVQVAGHCGKQFRVRNCVVARSFTHSCPRCGMEVQSAKASGRIQSKHKTPNGKACPKTEWVVK